MSFSNNFIWQEYDTLWAHPKPSESLQHSPDPLAGLGEGGEVRFTGMSLTFDDWVAPMLDVIIVDSDFQ